MTYLSKIKLCNTYTQADKIPFFVGDQRVGQIRQMYLEYLLKSGIFVYHEGKIFLSADLKTFEDRTDALKIFAKGALADDVTNIFMNEPYPVIETPVSKPVCLVDRSISTLLGLISFGQHLNGYVHTDEGMKMWIGRRASHRGYEAGKLDHIVAGGLPYGISLRENLEKECYEEAGMSKNLVSQAKSVGLVRYRYDYALGGKEDIIYCYDIALDEDFVPECTDGEVEEFYLMDIAQVAKIVKETDEFKLNCNLVVIDFLVRHGFIVPEDDDYIEIVKGLRGYK